MRDCRSICICLRACCRSILRCIFNILCSWRKSGIGCSRKERLIARPLCCADGISELKRRILWLETGSEVKPDIFPACIPLRVRRSMSLLIAGPVLLTKRRVWELKTAGAWGSTSHAPRTELREKTLLGAVVMRWIRRFELALTPAPEVKRGPSLAGPGNRRLRVSGNVGEATRRPWKGLRLRTSPGEMARPPWKVLLLTATEQFRPAGQL